MSLVNHSTEREAEMKESVAYAFNPDKHSLSNAEYLLSLKISEIQKLKKAAAILMRAGVSRETAVNLLIEQHRSRFS